MKLEKIVIKLEEGDQIARNGCRLFIRLKSEELKSRNVRYCSQYAVFVAKGLSVSREGEISNGNLHGEIEVSEIAMIGYEEDGKWVPFGEGNELKWVDYQPQISGKIKELSINYWVCRNITDSRSILSSV